MTSLTAPRFIDADAAREHLEVLHWPNGPVCPTCHSTDCKRLPVQYGRPSKRNPEGAARKGVIQCNACRRQFTVTVGTVFEDSKVPLNKWLLATHLLCASKKGMSAHQLHRIIGVTYKTAWFMFHRIREAMTPAANPPAMGGEGGMVEADETFIGRLKGVEPHKVGYQHKMKVLALVDRTTGEARSYVLPEVTVGEIKPILARNLAKEAFLMTDEARVYRPIGITYSGHGTVNHLGGEYVDAWKPHLHTNTVEGFFSIFKRGMRGIYQHCGEQHLHRYLAEFDFRYSSRIRLGVDDEARADKALLGSFGKRLTYRRTHQLAA